MSSQDFGSDARSDAVFERELLASAAGDHVGDDAVRAAWSRFAVTLGAAATLAGTTAAQSAPAGRLVAAEGRRALGWISLGALGGGIVTAALIAVLASHGGPATRVTTPGSVPSPASSTELGAPALAMATGPEMGRLTAPSADAPAHAAPAVAETTTTNEPRVSAPAAKPRGPHPPRAVPARTTAAHLDVPSSLAAEIALLDDARRAQSTGQFEQALALLARYHREHPHGELQRESDVLKVETLYLSGAHQEATRLAERFLEAFPDDPHVAHVRTFIR